MAPSTSPPRPDGLTLAAFGLLTLIVGFNVVGVRFSNFELPPFWGAGLRFAVAGAILFVIAFYRGAEAPRGRALAGSVAYGLLTFGLFFALAYWALVEITAGLASVILSLTPLATAVLAASVGLERLRLRSLLGGLIAVAGIAILFRDQLTTGGSIPGFVALLGAVASIAGANVLAKRLPKIDLYAMNAVGMGCAAVLLLLLSRAVGETWFLPEQAATLVAFAYLVIVGSILLFPLFIWLVRRWTASGVSYEFVLAPFVAIVAGMVLASEPVTPALIAGAVVTLLGVYVGAIWAPRRAERTARTNAGVARAPTPSVKDPADVPTPGPERP